MSELITWVQTNWVQIVAAGTLVVAAIRAVIIVTPTPKDDAVWDKVVKFLKTLGLHIEDKK